MLRCTAKVLVVVVVLYVVCSLSLWFLSAPSPPPPQQGPPIDVYIPKQQWLHTVYHIATV